MKYYEEEDYFKAGILFEEIIPIIRGTEKAEEAQYLYAYSQFYQKKYVLSGHYFQTFYETYNRSEYAMEALFMHAFSLYQDSPIFNLDQTSTREAIQSMQLFLNAYPYSKYADKANDIIDELRSKLEKKAFENASLYHDLDRYEAAVIALQNFEREFPDSEYLPEVRYLKMVTEYDYATQSVPAKQRERYLKAVKYYENLIDKHPGSKFVKDAEEMYSTILNKLEVIDEQDRS